MYCMIFTLLFVVGVAAGKLKRNDFTPRVPPPLPHKNKQTIEYRQLSFHTGMHLQTRRN